MKNNFFLIFAYFSKAFALDDLEINAKNISDKKNEVTIFEDQVFIKDEEKNIIEVTMLFSIINLKN